MLPLVWYYMPGWQSSWDNNSMLSASSKQTTVKFKPHTHKPSSGRRSACGSQPLSDAWTCNQNEIMKNSRWPSQVWPIFRKLPDGVTLFSAKRKLHKCVVRREIPVVSHRCTSSNEKDTKHSQNTVMASSKSTRTKDRRQSGAEHGGKDLSSSWRNIEPADTGPDQNHSHLFCKRGRLRELRVHLREKGTSSLNSTFKPSNFLSRLHAQPESSEMFASGGSCTDRTPTLQPNTLTPSSSQAQFRSIRACEPPQKQNTAVTAATKTSECEHPGPGRVPHTHLFHQLYR